MNPHLAAIYQLFNVNRRVSNFWHIPTFHYWNNVIFVRMFVGTVQRIFLYSKKEVVYGWYCLQSWQIWCLKTLCTHKKWGSPTLQTVPELKKLLLWWTGRCEVGISGASVQERRKLMQKDEEIVQMQKLMAKLESNLPKPFETRNNRLTVWVRRPSGFIDLEELLKKVASDNCTSSYGHAEDGKGVPDGARWCQISADYGLTI